MDTPAKPLQNVLTQAVPVACRRARVVRAAVTLDTDQVAPRSSRVHHTHINPVPRAANLRVYNPATVAQYADDSSLEWAIRL